MNEKIVQFLKKRTEERGMKYTFMSKVTGIDYQRLMRIFNQGAIITGSELLKISVLLEVDQSELTSVVDLEEKSA